jgi:hypothetical protein
MTDPHPATVPEIVPGPKKVSVLESALKELEGDDSKFAHLGPAQRDALRTHIAHQRNQIEILKTQYTALLRSVNRFAEELEA